MTNLPFHPLADLFPLIEGKDFDDLVASIRESGQREPIITLNGMILDGRNRYRACLAAGVPPDIRPFKGGDEVQFVVDMNVHRRHLKQGQRALIGAKLMTLRRGRPSQSIDDNRKNINDVETTLILSGQEAAEMLKIDRHTLQCAKTVLKDGTEEEIAAVQSGKVGVTSTARAIRERRPDTAKSPQQRGGIAFTGKNPKRIENIRLRKSLWDNLREAFDRIGNLPLPADVARELRAFGRAANINQRLPRALRWLEEFSHAWNELETTGRKDNADAGNGTSALGNQHDQPPPQ